MQSRIIATDLNSLQQSLDEIIKKIQQDLIPTETDESKDYVRALNVLRTALLVRYSDAQLLANQEQMQKIINFVNNFHLATDTMIHPKSDSASCMSAIQNALYAAQQCETPQEKIAKQAETISPIFYVLGGFVGLLLGIPLGVVVGLVLGVAVLVGAMAKTYMNFIPTDPFIYKFWFSCCAAVGAVYGAYQGAIIFSEKFQNGYTSFCKWFRPHVSISELGSNLLTHTIFCNRTRIQKKEVGQHLLPELTKMITNDFLSNDSVDAAHNHNHVSGNNNS